MSFSPNILATIFFHNQSNSNGILSSNKYFLHTTNGTFIGTYRIKSKNKSLILNVYSNNEKKNFLYDNNCYLFINSIIGNVYGFIDKEAVEMEFVGLNNLITAKKIILTPKTIDDYKIINETSSLIEEIFLNQINVLQKDQIIVLWIQDNLYVTMIVKDIETDYISKNNAYKLNNTTNVIIEAINKIEPKNHFDDLLKISQKTLKNKVYRILDDDKYNLSYSTILISDNTIPYGLYIVLVDHLNGSFEGCLKNIPSVVPDENHCFIPKHFNTRAYSKITINSVPFNKIKKIDKIILQCDDDQKNKKKQIEKFLNIDSEYSAIVIGSSTEILTDHGTILTKNSSKDYYGYFFTDSFPKIILESTPLSQRKKTTNNESCYSNLGKELEEINLFDYQKKVLNNVLKYYKLINTSFSNIILLKGKEGFGKSTIVEQLSKKLFVENFVFSIKIDCLGIRNQKPSKIFEEFQNKLLYLKTTFPSLLIVDSFDAITFKRNFFISFWEN